ncbi:MAG: sigma factor-like helix-turn-helix DNA-binding protein, partial [Candidatus Pacebacteria bacterium]|nr:sigma factor-like helix-turn-helix DNA-binding protein [Candidatus Paceibacterota bacterium]
MNNYQFKGDEKFANTRSRQNERRFLELAESLLADMSGRSGEIVKKRYGLLGGKKETLESIGDGYGITRERVRQIIAEATKRVAQKMDHPDFLEAEEKIIFTIEANNGIIRESEMAEKFSAASDKETNAVRFLAGVSGKIFEFEEKGILEKVWVVSLDSAKRAKKIIAETEKILKEEKKLLPDEEILERLSERGFLHPESELISYLEAAALIKKNKFGKWGLIHWKEVSPKGTREKV